MTTQNEKHVCPCCGHALPGPAMDYAICPVCQWEDDPVQRKDPDFAGGANKLSLNQARKAWSASRPRPRRIVKLRRYGRGRN